MTSAAIEDKILSYSYTTNTGDITGVTAGTGLSGGGSSGGVTLNVSGLTVSEFAANSIQLSSESFSNDDTSIMTSAAIEDKILSYGYTTGMTFVIEDDDGTEVSISNAEELRLYSSNTSIDINYTDISPGSDADPFDLSFTTLHAPYLYCEDDRNLQPADLTSANRQIRGFFSSKTGLEDGTTNGSDYVDALVLETYNGGSGGDANLLAFSKTSTQRIYHYRADQADTDWGSASTLAYTSDLASTMGSGNSYAAGLTPAGNATHGGYFLRRDGTWVVPPDTDTNTTYSAMGSGNSYAAGLVIAGSSTHGDTFLRKDGTWATPTDTNTDTTYSAGTGLALSSTTFSVDGAQTGITTDYNTGRKVGRDADNQIDFSTDNEMRFRVNGANQIKIINNAVVPFGGDDDIDIGESGNEFKDGYFDGTLYADTLDVHENATVAGTLQGYKTVIKAVSSNTSLVDADSGKTIYWTGGTLTLPANAEAGQQFVIINNTNGAATPSLGSGNAIATNWTAHAAMADETARTYICPVADKWIYIG
tara:strand:- start:22 stop:1623 length:1602 start_codon:yes stop_codon:yes gene_type:complete